MKVCRLCGEEKSLDEFHFRAATKDQRNSYCKPCACAETQRWYRENREVALVRQRLRSTPEKRKGWNLRRYNITTEDYEKQKEKQGGVCAICKIPSTSSLHVDHNHATGELRGLLCHGCNTGIGLFRENPAVLATAAWYLEQPSVTKRQGWGQ